MKKLITQYTFDKTAKTVTLNDYTDVSLESLLLITNVTDGVIIYNFADPTSGATVSGNVITLEYDTIAMDNADKIQIYFDDPEYQPTSYTQQTDIKDLTEAILNAAEQLTFLANVRGVSADMRVTLLGGALSTLTTLTTLSNITNVGGFPAVQHMPSVVNQTAIQSNINNVVQS